MPELSIHRLIATRRGRRWSRWVATCALVALAWPSLGPLPWLARGLHERDPAVHAPGSDASHAQGSDASHAQGGDGSYAHRHADASSIPGSPTHPADHDCAECQVLQHLSRCVPPAPVLPIVPVVCIREPPPQGVLVVASPTRFSSPVPPARAPPRSIG